MRLRYRSMRGLLAVLAVLAIALPAFGQNMLANPGFESDLTGWATFGNTSVQAANPPQYIPHNGNKLGLVLGNWSGPYNVSGAYQEFPAIEGDQFQLSCWARHWKGDPLVGNGPPDFNWVAQRIVFLDASDNELDVVESTILDGTSRKNGWNYSGTIVGTAPPGTAKVRAYILYTQPGSDGGTANIDDVELIYLGSIPTESSTWGKIKALFKE